jgi:hypothetical protein
MRMRRLVVVLMLIAAVVILGFTVGRNNWRAWLGTAQANALTTPEPISSPAPSQKNHLPMPLKTTERADRATKIVSAVFDAPISFFGKVQDQNGTPVAAAKVEFGAIDKFWQSGSNYNALSDDKGMFAITGIKGAGLTVAVSKEGYGGINGLSYQSFGYGMPPDSTRKRPPSRDAPAVFVLRKKAAADPLVAFRRDIMVPKDGTPVEISIRDGKRVAGNMGDVVFRCWTADEVKDAQGRYPWHAQMSVRGGGIQERGNPELEFEAPEEGYASSLEVNMLEGSAQWREDSDHEYWFKLRNGTYGRMRCRITTGGEHFVTVDVVLNPSGSRNLEYDENNIAR